MRFFVSALVDRSGHCLAGRFAGPRPARGFRRRGRRQGAGRALLRVMPSCLARPDDRDDRGAALRDDRQATAGGDRRTCGVPCRAASADAAGEPHAAGDRRHRRLYREPEIAEPRSSPGSGEFGGRDAVLLLLGGDPVELPPALSAPRTRRRSGCPCLRAARRDCRRGRRPPATAASRSLRTASMASSAASSTIFLACCGAPAESSLVVRGKREGSAPTALQIHLKLTDRHRGRSGSNRA